jgi:hypothetical protein
MRRQRRRQRERRRRAADRGRASGQEAEQRLEAEPARDDDRHRDRDRDAQDDESRAAPSRAPATWSNVILRPSSATPMRSTLRAQNSIRDRTALAREEVHPEPDQQREQQHRRAVVLAEERRRGGDDRARHDAGKERASARSGAIGQVSAVIGRSLGWWRAIAQCGAPAMRSGEGRSWRARVDGIGRRRPRALRVGSVRARRHQHRADRDQAERRHDRERRREAVRIRQPAGDDRAEREAEQVLEQRQAPTRRSSGLRGGSRR